MRMNRNLQRAGAAAGAALVLGGTAAPAAAEAFIHLRSYNVNNIFTGAAGSPGQRVGDVVYDGTNVYLAGYHQIGGGGPAGLARVNNILGIPSGTALAPAWVVSLNHAVIPNDSRVVYEPSLNQLYLGTGFVNTSVGPDVSGVRVLDPATGLQLWPTRTPGSYGAINQIDSIDIDPGLGGAGPLFLGVEDRFDPFIRTGDIISASNIAPGFATYTLRSHDLSFAPNGDAWSHAIDAATGVGAIVSQQRIAPLMLAAPVPLVTFPEPDGPQATVLYLPLSQVFPAEPDLLLFNQRGGPPEVQVITTAGVVRSPIKGDEPTVDGGSPPPFANWELNYSYHITPIGGMLLFVVHGGTGAGGMADRLEIYAVCDALPVGDLDGDGCVDFDDLLILLGCYGPSPCGDVDGDGDTDFNDLVGLLSNYGTCCY